MLEFDGLSKAFGTIQALDGVSFRVPDGALHGFVGANGAGKTTAMRIALGVLLADAGEVRWRGRRIDEEVRRRVGYMPEERGLYPKLRVRDHLRYLAALHDVGPAAAGARADALLDRLGLGSRADEQVQRLSLGNQQRVQLAAALVHDPEVLVLDEPFSGLDPVAVDTLADVLRERAATGVPVLFSSHQLDLVERLCDRVVIIAAGRVVADGTVADLRRADAPRRYEVVVVDGGGAAVPGWWTLVPGVVAGRLDGGVALVDLAPEGDERPLLAAACGAGRMLRFGPVEPSLVEVFRQVVAP